MVKKLSFFLIFINFTILYGQDLSINARDLSLELRPDGGFHLFIRKKPDISSVLLTETTRDPSFRSSNYAYRAGEWNSINGDEIRILNGVPISKESRIYSLVSSTVVNHPVLGEAFHIYLPYILYYGYPDQRHGEVYLTDGTYLNVRAFALPYADYAGAFKDNPFTLEARQEPPPGHPAGIYLSETLDAFKEIANTGGGGIVYSRGPDDVVDLIKTLLESEKGKTLDIVICLDTTNSMRKYIDALRQKLIPMLREILNDFTSFRIGMILFKDYHESYLTKVVPFTNSFSKFQSDLSAIRVQGGGDIPEAVYEALYDGAVKFNWEAEARMMILIGDAPPHPAPRGKITKEMANKASAEKNITVNAMILPQ